MKTPVTQPLHRLFWLLFVTVIAGVGMVGCKTPEAIPKIIPDVLTTVSPVLVSVQPVGSDQAEIIVKAGFDFGAADWKLTLLDAAGKPLPLTAGTAQRLGLFILTPYRATGLTTNQTLKFRFATRNAGGDSVRLERAYTHRTTGPRWVRLAHAPLVGGDFAGSALSTDNIPSLDVGEFLSVWRYQSDDTWQTLLYYVAGGSWFPERTLPPTIRHGLVRYRLQETEGVAYNFSGLGFVQTELLPGERVYQKDMVSPPTVGNVVPYYAGPDGDLRWFVTADRAYQLTEGGSAQVWVRRGSWAQYRTADLPEPTGTLAAFRIGTVGYVVNQRSGQQAHLWAFDTQTERWSRRADFPGSIRSRGAGFATGGTGYFGLGLNVGQQSLRDLWQYDPATDRWQYATDYPGQASTYLTVGQTAGHTLLGWGYEQQPTATEGIRLVGCSDFWEFKP